jgi:hypothetical protein
MTPKQKINIKPRDSETVFLESGRSAANGMVAFFRSFLLLMILPLAALG